MRHPIIITALSLFSLSAHAINYDVVCEGRTVANMSIAQGEHSLSIIGNPNQYGYSVENEKIAVQDKTEQESSETKRLEYFFNLKDSLSPATVFSYHRDGELVLLLPDGNRYHNCKIGEQ